MKIRRDTLPEFVYPWLPDSLPRAIFDAVFKYRCDVISLSFYIGGYSVPLKQAVYDCYNNGTLLVSTSTNADGANIFYPSCLRNDWVLFAQGSSRHPQSEADTIPERRCSSLDPLYHPPSVPTAWGAQWPIWRWPTPGLAVDVTAPASHMCVLYADSLVVGGVEKKPFFNCRNIYAGVSYAPPQVAATAALMLGENPDLTVDDLQGLISASCTDITTDYNESGDLTGWDKYTGWGRINTDSCLIFCDPLHPACYQVEHYAVSKGGTVVDSTTTGEVVEFG
jgi:hypothetical protein